VTLKPVKQSTGTGRVAKNTHKIEHCWGRWWFNIPMNELDHLQVDGGLKDLLNEALTGEAWLKIPMK